MNLFALKPHPYSQIFPADLNGSGFAELVASVKKLGRIRNAVIVYKNQILDGNRRLRACKIAKVEPRHIEFKGTDTEALEVVWDLNYNRRDLTPSQRAVAFAQYCNFADSHRPEEGSHVTPLSEAAEKAHVGEKTMQRAKKVIEHGTKKQIESIKLGKATVFEVASSIAKSESKNGASDVDALGFPVPEGEAQKFWERRYLALEISAQLRAAKTRIKSLSPDDPMWSEVNLNGVLGSLSDAINRFAASVPAYVCVYCQGINPKKCTTCKGRGVISKFMWSMVPEELRKMREKQCHGRAS